MDYLRIIAIVFLALAFIAFWKLSRVKYFNRNILSLKGRILIALIFPILLVFLIFFGGVIILILIGIFILAIVLFLLFLMFGRGKIYYRKF